MSFWPLNRDECSGCHCSANRRRYGARGYCYRCYYFVQRLEAATGWIFEKPKALGKFVPEAWVSYISELSKERFELFKSAYISTIKRELGRLRITERKRAGEISSLDLEYKFGEVLKLLSRNSLQPRNASFLAAMFNREQLSTIYSLLDDMMDASIRNSDHRAIKAGCDAINH